MAKPVAGQGDSTEAQPWYAPGLRFECTQCGNCCTGPPGYVWFDEEEASAMAAHLEMDVLAFLEKYATKKYGRWTLEETKRQGKYDCVFLVRDEAGKAGCSLYSVRPAQCRTWPFWDSNLGSARAWKSSAKGCPGMKLPGEEGGAFVPVEEIRVRLKENPKGL